MPRTPETHAPHAARTTGRRHAFRASRHGGVTVTEDGGFIVGPRPDTPAHSADPDITGIGRLPPLRAPEDPALGTRLPLGVPVSRAPFSGLTRRYCVYTPEQLQARLEYWQACLRLQDWDIEVRLVRGATIGQGTSGELHTFRLKKRALIKILREDDYEAALEGAVFDQPHDMEYTLVHELVHLALDACTVQFDPGTIQETAEEHAVHALASALVALDRCKSTYREPFTPPNSADGFKWLQVYTIGTHDRVEYRLHADMFKCLSCGLMAVRREDLEHAECDKDQE
jgi:hypothetical protein